MKTRDLVLTSAISILFLATPALAKSEVAIARAKGFSEKCSTIENRVKNKTDIFGNRQTAHMAVYNNMIDRIEKFIARAKEAKLDTTKAEADLVVLKEKIAIFKTDYTAFNTGAINLKANVCDKQEGTFKTSLSASHAQLKIVHEDAGAIRTFWRETMKLDLLALREKTDEADANTSSTNTNN